MGNQKELNEDIFKYIEDKLKTKPIELLKKDKFTYKGLKFIKREETPISNPQYSKMDIYLMWIRSNTKEWDVKVNITYYENSDNNLLICIPFQRNPEGNGLKVLWFWIFPIRIS